MERYDRAVLEELHDRVLRDGVPVGEGMSWGKVAAELD